MGRALKTQDTERTGEEKKSQTEESEREGKRHKSAVERKGKNDGRIKRKQRLWVTVGRGLKRENKENLCYYTKEIENSHGHFLSNHQTNACNELARSR